MDFVVGFLGVQEHNYSAVSVVAIDSTVKQIVWVFHIPRIF